MNWRFSPPAPRRKPPGCIADHDQQTHLSCGHEFSVRRETHAEYLQATTMVLFAEGRLSTTGSLMKLFDGTAFFDLQNPRQSHHLLLARRASTSFFTQQQPEKNFPRASLPITARC